MSKPKACPHCGRRLSAFPLESKAEEGLSPFAEFGDWIAADDCHEFEGNLDGWKCGACGGHFFTAPPNWNDDLNRLQRLIREDKRSCGTCDGEGEVAHDGQAEKCEDCGGTGELAGRP